MIQYGKYSPSHKLQNVCTIWESGVTDGPEYAEVDRFQRSLLQKWERYARAHGIAAVQEHVRENMAGADWVAIDRLLADFCRGGLTRPERISAAPAIVDVEELRAVFTRGALLALDYTEDDDEIPTVDVLRTRSLPYPVEYLAGQHSALAIFVSAFLGRNDVMHLLDAKIGRVTLVDRDKYGMDLIRRIYPSHWSYHIADYVEYLEAAIARYERYDVVSCDPMLSMAEEVAWTNVDKIMQLCNNIFITNYTGEMLAAIGFDEADLPTMSARLSKKIGMKLTIRGLYPRLPGQAHHWVVMGR